MGLLATVEFESVTGLPEDRKVNSFAFVGGQTFSAVGFGSVSQILRNFYNSLQGANTVDLASWMSPDLSRAAGAHLISIWTISSGQFTPVKGDASTFLGSPAHTETMTLDATTQTTGLPAEVAVKLRFEATGRSDAPVETADGIDPGTAADRPKQRHTGGIFFGPVTFLAVAPSPPARPHPNFVDDLAEAGRFLAEQVVTEGIDNAQLGVWSRSDGAIRSLESVAVDNAFDTQRRRGPAPTVVDRLVVA